MSSGAPGRSAYDSRRTRNRYDRLAPFYDLLEWLPERGPISRWRKRQWQQVPVGRVIEVGVGTG